MEHDIPFGNSNRENGPTFLDFPLFQGIFQWDEPKKRVPFTAESEIPEILTKWKAPLVSISNHPWREEPGNEFRSRISTVQAELPIFSDHLFTCQFYGLIPPIDSFFSWNVKYKTIKVSQVCSTSVRSVNRVFIYWLIRAPPAMEASQ